MAEEMLQDAAAVVGSRVVAQSPQKGGQEGRRSPERSPTCFQQRVVANISLFPPLAASPRENTHIKVLAGLKGVK